MPAIHLTPEQEQIVHAELAHHVITAVAGSGKTTTLAYRIRYLLENGVDSRRLMVLMFNKAAQQDFASKLNQIVPNDMAKPEVRTFHAMGYRLYQRFVREGYLQAFSSHILSEKEAQFQVFKLATRLLDSSQVLELKRNKKEHIELCLQFFETVKAGLNAPELVFEQMDLDIRFRYFIELFSEFESWRKQHCRISYADMLYDPVKAIHANPALRKLVSDKMDVILVDEYQDTNDIQHDLLKIIAGTRAKVTIVGDPDQTIYEFRGAKPEYMIEGFAKEFPSAKTLNLSYSFRYGHSISLLANHLIANNAGRRDLLCMSHQDNPATQVKLHQSNVDSDVIVNQLKQADDWSQYAILTRVWSQTVGIELAFLEQGIPYRIEGQRGVFNSDEAQNIRSLLELSAGHFKLFSHEQRQQKLELLFRFPHAGLPESEAKRLAFAVSAYSEQFGRELLALIPVELKKIQLIKLERLAKALTHVEQSNQPVKRVLRNYVEQNELFDGIRSLSLSADYAEEKIASIESILRFVFTLAGDASEVLERLTELQIASEQQSSHLAHQKNRNSVHISTIHRAKGLEWHTVFVPGLNDRLFPYSLRSSKLSASIMQSERRLLYVAMTRAKQMLHLIVPNRKEHTLQPSRFESELRAIQSLKLGEALDQKLPQYELPSNIKASRISQRYAARFDCTLRKGEKTQLSEESDQPIWFASRVRHQVLGEGNVTDESHSSFTVEFEGNKQLVFSKETADRFFTVVC